MSKRVVMCDMRKLVSLSAFCVQYLWSHLILKFVSALSLLLASETNSHVPWSKVWFFYTHVEEWSSVHKYRDNETDYKDAHHGITDMGLLQNGDGMVEKISKTPCFSRISVAHPNAEIEDGWASQFGHWILASLDLKEMGKSNWGAYSLKISTQPVREG